MNTSIEAGAGTGKTTTVISILLDHLLGRGTDPVEPSRILALTFTVKASNEMRERLGSWLTRLRSGESIKELSGGLELFGPKELIEPRLVKSLYELDRMEIGTIHSFAAHILKQYPIEARVNPEFEEDEGESMTSLFREKWPVWLRNNLEDEKSRNLFSRILDYAGTDSIAEFAKELCYEGIPLELPQKYDKWNDLINQRLELAQHLYEKYHGIESTPNTHCLDALKLISSLLTGKEDFRRLEAASFVSRPKPTRSWSGWSDDDWKKFLELRSLAKEAATTTDKTISELLAWLRPFVEKIRAEYLKRGYISMRGLLYFACRLLRENVEVRERFKQRFKLVIVDEFQDIDPLQGEMLMYIAERLRSSASEWNDISLDDNKMHIVGDKKQSIYLFRGADLEAYQAIADKVTGNKKERIKHLSRNQRSKEEIIHFVNRVCENVVRFPEYVPIEPARGKGGHIEMALYKDVKADEARELEAEFIGDWIQKCVSENKFNKKDVAILLKALSDSYYYTDALRRRGIDFIIEGEKYFHGTQEVIDFRNLLTLISNPVNEIAAVGVLRSPFGALPDNAIKQLRDEGALCPVDFEKIPKEWPHIRKLYETIGLLHERSLRIRVRDLLQELNDKIPSLEIASATYKGQQALMNILKFSEQLTSDPFATLGQALADANRRFRDLEEDGESPLADEQFDTVQILSIHKSKGLEFPVVIIPDIHRAGQRQQEGKPVLHKWLTGEVGFRCGKWQSNAYAVLKRHEEELKEQELRRLFYVSLTRAKDFLLLTGGWPCNKNEKSLGGLLQEGLEAAGCQISMDKEKQILEGKGFTVLVTFPHGEQVEKKLESQVTTQSDVDLSLEQQEWEKRDAYARAVENSPRFYHPSLTKEADIDRVFRLELDTEEPAITVGSKCHDILATIDLTDPKAEGDDETAKILRTFFTTNAFREIQKSENVYREVPFIIKLEDKIWSGQIDVVYRMNGRWIVADYKSDREETPSNYQLQAEVYSKAIKVGLGLESLPEFRIIYLRTGNSHTISV